MGFAWKGKAIATVGEVGDAAAALTTREEAREFMRLYLQYTPHAYMNIGYIAGYHDTETRNRILDLCETAHPIFGRTNPTPEEAFELGRRHMEMVKGEEH